MISATHRQRSGKTGETLVVWSIFDSRKYPGHAPGPILCTGSTQTIRYSDRCSVCAEPGIADHSCKCTLRLSECGCLAVVPTTPDFKFKYTVYYLLFYLYVFLKKLNL